MAYDPYGSSIIAWPSMRLLPDPHASNYQWRVVDGERQVRWNSLQDFGQLLDSNLSISTGWVGPWIRTAFDALDESELAEIEPLFTHTPERVAMWADLALNPTAQ